MNKLPTDTSWFNFLLDLESDSPTVAACSEVTQLLVKESSLMGHDFDPYKFAFSKLLHQLRLDSGLSIDELSQKISVDADQLKAIESDPTYKAPARTLSNLAFFYHIPFGQIAILAGVQKKPSRVKEDLLAYAAKSDSFEKLSTEEKKVLHQFLKILRDH